MGSISSVTLALYALSNSLRSKDKKAEDDNYEVFLEGILSGSTTILFETLESIKSNPTRYIGCLRSQLSDLLSISSRIDMLGHFSEDESKWQEINEKLKKKLNKKYLEVLLILFFFADENNLQKELRKIIFDFSNYCNWFSEYDQSPFWQFHFRLHPDGTRAVPGIPYEDYLAVALFHSKQTGHSSIELPKTFMKIGDLERLKNKIEKVEIEKIVSWGIINETQFTAKKTEILKIVESAISEAKKVEQRFIERQELSPQSVSTFLTAFKSEKNDGSMIPQIFDYYEKLENTHTAEESLLVSRKYEFGKETFIKDPRYTNFFNGFGDKFAQYETYQLLEKFPKGETYNVKDLKELVSLLEKTAFSKNTVVILGSDIARNLHDFESAFSNRYISKNEKLKKNRFYRGDLKINKKTVNIFSNLILEGGYLIDFDNTSPLKQITSDDGELLMSKNELTKENKVLFTISEKFILPGKIRLIQFTFPKIPNEKTLEKISSH